MVLVEHYPYDLFSMEVLRLLCRLCVCVCACVCVCVCLVLISIPLS